jgi:hypothetical protein
VNSDVLSYSSGCLLIAHVIPLRNSVSNPESALYEGRFHSIIYRDVQSRGGIPNKREARHNNEPQNLLVNAHTQPKEHSGAQGQYACRGRHIFFSDSSPDEGAATAGFVNALQGPRKDISRHVAAVRHHSASAESRMNDDQLGVAIEGEAMPEGELGTRDSIIRHGSGSEPPQRRGELNIQSFSLGDQERGSKGSYQ